MKVLDATFLIDYLDGVEATKAFYRRSRPSASGLDPEGEGRQKTYQTK
jgi:hypothetical protein